MNIRIAKKEDLSSIVNIYNQAILTKKCTADTETFEVKDKINWFNQHNCKLYPLYVYEIDQKIVGYIYLSPYRPGRKAMKYIAEISYYIHKDYQRLGIGSQMMDFTINQAKELGFRDLVAILLEWNIPSVKLLKKFSFTEWGRLPDIADFDGNLCSHLYYGLKI